MPRPVFLVLIAVAIVALALALVVGLVWWRQERIVFQPPPGPWPHPADVRRVQYEAADGQPLFAYVVGDHAPGRPVLVAFHGNADLAVWQLEWAQEVVRRTGWTVVAAEYRGYAGLPGAPTYAHSAIDARAAYTMVRDTLGTAPEDIALFGHSLGSAIAMELASALDSAGATPYAVLLQSPFTSARAMARIVAAPPVVAMWGAISRVHFDSEARARTLRAPVHVAHGVRDMLIPLRMGRAVHAAALRQGSLLQVPGAGHNDVADVAGERYWKWLVNAVRDRSAPAVAPGSQAPVRIDPGRSG